MRALLDFGDWLFSRTAVIAVALLVALYLENPR